MVILRNVSLYNTADDTSTERLFVKGYPLRKNQPSQIPFRRTSIFNGGVSIMFLSSTNGYLFQPS